MTALLKTMKNRIAALAAAAALSASGADIVAHRGENTQAPENSIPAFKAAFANGRTQSREIFTSPNPERWCAYTGRMS